jgi:uncharacterized protein YlxW (UPF0749 family)
MAIEPQTIMIALPAMAMVTVGWVVNTWLRVRHGYPLENSWGKSVYPRTDDAVQQRLALLTQENAQLRAELGSAKDRLANVERIVTDEAHALNREIEQLRGKAN